MWPCMAYRANARLNPAWVLLGQRGDYWEFSPRLGAWFYIPPS
jgi:hypothetical protein